MNIENRTLDYNRMPLLAHLSELRQRLLTSIIALVICFFLSFLVYDFVIEILQKPFLAIDAMFEENVLYINTIFEGFVVRLKIAVLTALVFSSPIHLFNIIRFVFPGLHKNERRIISIALICSFVFFIIGFFYSYYAILPAAINFLTSKGFIPDNTGILLNFGGNISYVLQFIFVALIVFQIPIILEILMILNIISRNFLMKNGRYVIILFFILSAILTPPDFITQIGIALPLSLLYYLTILVAKIFRFGEE